MHEMPVLRYVVRWKEGRKLCQKSFDVKEEAEDFADMLDELQGKNGPYKTVKFFRPTFSEDYNMENLFSRKGRRSGLVPMRYAVFWRERRKETARKFHTLERAVAYRQMLIDSRRAGDGLFVHKRIVYRIS